MDFARENDISDEDFFVYKAKQAHDVDPFTCKAWMITAKSLFPKNFSVQFEAYNGEKAINNAKEASRYFSTLFKDFPNEPGLWREVHGITEALQSSNASPAAQFHRELFSNLSIDVQHHLLIAMAERTGDILDHCRLMLLLINRFPQSIDIHGKKLVDTLLAAEKHGYRQDPVNCFRKLLVVDLFPLLLSSKSVEIQPKLIYRLLLKAIDFYLSWLSAGTSAVQGIMDADLKPGDAWKNLFKIISLTGWKLGWELSAVFSVEGSRELMCQRLWTFYRSSSLGGEESPSFRQLLYCTLLLLIESLYDYASRLDPAYFQGQGGGAHPLVLVKSFAEGRGKPEEGGLPISGGSVGLVSSFLAAVSCWELLHQTEDLRKEFGKICQTLRTETWPWLSTFLCDALLYQGLYAEALTKLQPMISTGSPANKQYLLKAAGIYLALGNTYAAADHVMSALPDWSSQQAMTVSPISKQQNLHFLNFSAGEILQYSVTLLVSCVRDKALRNPNMDLAIGHLTVLLQADWPRYADIFEEVVEKVKSQGHFCYPLFSSYVIQIDILEEFAFLATDQGGQIHLDIFPQASSQMASQRRMTTRWGDKGAREEFRAAMKRQSARSQENVPALLSRFLVQERETLLQIVS